MKTLKMTHFLGKTLVLLLICSSCYAQDYVAFNRQKQNGRRIQYFAIGMLSAAIIYSEYNKSAEKQTPKYLPYVGAGVWAVGFTIEIRAHNKLKKRK